MGNVAVHVARGRYKSSKICLSSRNGGTCAVRWLIQPGRHPVPNLMHMETSSTPPVLFLRKSLLGTALPPPYRCASGLLYANATSRANQGHSLNMAMAAFGARARATGPMGGSPAITVPLPRRRRKPGTATVCACRPC